MTSKDDLELDATATPELDATATPQRDADATVASAGPTGGPASAGGGADAGAAELHEVSPRRYAMLGEVGRGGLGRVLRARDVHLQRNVALKELLSGDVDTRRRFVREALVTARLQHPSIVPIYEAGRWPDQGPFYAMKLVAGQPLANAIAGADSLEKRLAMVPTVLAVADAIAYAHSEHVIHRDLKPQNVIVGAFGETVVIDWGLAKDLAAAEQDTAGAAAGTATGDATAAGSVLGTPAYMAPEQAAGDEADKRADVYALGAMLYHVVTGKAPHRDTTVERMLARVIAGEIVPVTEAEPRVPTDLAAIVGKAMALELGDRYPSAAEFADDLRRFTTGQLVGAHRYTLGERARRWIRRHRAAAAVTAIAVVVLAGFGIWSFRRIAHQRDLAVANANVATIARARSAVATGDAAEALAWLAQVDTSGPGWDSARVIAADALAHPRLTNAIPGVVGTPMSHARFSRDGSTYLRWSTQSVITVDLRANTVRSYVPNAIPIEDSVLYMCRDHARVVGVGRSEEPHHELELTGYELELASGKQTMHRGTDAIARALGGCTDEQRFTVEDGSARLMWWDGRALRSLTDDKTDAVVQTPDGHALSIAHGEATWWEPASDRHAVLGAIGTGTEGAELASTSDDGRVAAYVGTRLAILRVDRPPVLVADVTAAVVAHDGSWVIAANAIMGRLDRYDAAGHSDGPYVRGRVRELALSPDNRWLVAFADVITLVDLTMGTTVELHEGIDALTPDGRLAGLSHDGVLRLWKPVLPDVRAWPGTQSPDKRWRVVATPTDGVLRYERRAATPPERALTGSHVTVDAVADDGSALLNVWERVYVWRPGAAPIELGTSTGQSLRWSPLGVPQGIGDVITEWRDGKPHQVWPAAGVTVHSFRDCTADLHYVAAIKDELITVTDTTTGAEQVVDGALPGAVAFSPDGSQLAASARLAGGGIMLWDVASHRATTFATPNRLRHAFAFAPDGGKLVAASESALTVFDLATGASQDLSVAGEVLQLDGRPPGVVFDRAGQRLAAVTSIAIPPRSSREDVMLWDLASGERRTIFGGYADSISFDDTGVDVLVGHAAITIADDLPRSPDALSERLRAEPYTLDPDTTGTLRIRLR